MKQFIVLLLAFTFIFPAHLFAQETPTIIDLSKGEKAPFSGVLLNPPAAAQMLANQKFTEAECKLKIDFELDRIKAQHDFMMKSLEISMAASEKKNEAIIKIKDEEITRLVGVVEESSGDYSQWWAAGGFIVGALLSLGIFYAAAEAGN